MAAFMLAQGRQHIGSIGEGQVAVRASVPCASLARANFATNTSAKPPEVVAKVPAMVGKSPNPVPPVTISRRDVQNRVPGPVLTGLALVTGRFLSPDSAALLDTLIEDEFR